MRKLLTVLTCILTFATSCDFLGPLTPNKCIDASKIRTDLFCTQEYEPVCGCNGTTYPNTCNAEASGVTSWVKGKCEDLQNQCIDSSKIKDPICTREYNPVCGCNDVTYANPCLAEAAGLVAWRQGACNETSECIDETKIDDDMFCTQDYAPVCGCNDVTYSNTCAAEKAGVTSWTDGRCDLQTEDCIDPEEVKPNLTCIQVYQPVCGCNGITYANLCEANKAGIKNWVAGECFE